MANSSDIAGGLVPLWDAIGHRIGYPIGCRALFTNPALQEVQRLFMSQVHLEFFGSFQKTNRVVEVAVDVLGHLTL